MRTSLRRTSLAAMLLAVALCGACGSSSSSGPRAAAPEVSTTTMTFTDYRSALTARLSAEWGDPALAARVVAGLDQTTVDTYAARIPMGEVMTSPRLVYRVPTQAGPVDSILVYSFGYRGPDGERQPGPVNEAMARAVAEYVRMHPTPVYAQIEPAKALRALGVTDVTEVPLQRRSDGTVIYQSTADFTSQLLAQLSSSGRRLGRTAVVGFSDHEGRCLLIARGAGIDAVSVDGITAVSTYDPESSQPWTRSREAYLPIDLSQRFA